MLQDWTFWFFVVCMTLGVGIIVFVRKFGSRRFRESVRQFADEHGFREVHPREVVDSRQKQQLELLKRSSTGKVTDAWEGIYQGESFRIFTYSYNFGIPLIAHVRYAQTVVSLQWRGPELPVFAMGPKSDMDRGLGTLRWSKVTPAEGEFFRRNWIMSPEPMKVRALLDNGFGIFLHTLPTESRVTVESGGGRLIALRKGCLLHAGSWPALLEESLAFAQALRSASTSVVPLSKYFPSQEL